MRKESCKGLASTVYARTAGPTFAKATAEQPDLIALRFEALCHRESQPPGEPGENERETEEEYGNGGILES
jgi:hypothetical protein